MTEHPHLTALLLLLLLILMLSPHRNIGISKYQNIQQNSFLPTVETGYLPTAGAAILGLTSEFFVSFKIIVKGHREI